MDVESVVMMKEFRCFETAMKTPPALDNVEPVLSLSIL